MSSLNVVRVNSDYKIQVEPGKTIWLDTGDGIGLVYVTGDLNVKGQTTTISSSNVSLKDRILFLNDGETGNGVSLGTSGIEIVRGTALTGNAQFLWDESIEWEDPSTSQTRQGCFVFKTHTTDPGILNGIRTNSIDTAGGKLALISKGAGIVTVRGTENYEQQVLDYAHGLVPWDDDIIPNMKAVDDKILYQLFNNPSDRIIRSDSGIIAYDNNITSLVLSFDSPGNTYVKVSTLLSNEQLNITPTSYLSITNSGIDNLDGSWPVSSASQNDSYCYISTLNPVTAQQVTSVANVIVNNSQTVAKKSNVKIKIDDTVTTKFEDDNVSIFDLILKNSSIETSSSVDLILNPLSRNVRITNNLKIDHKTITPLPTVGSVTIYTDTEGVGNTGIYYVNSTVDPNTNDYKRDELISKKKAIAFAILM